MPEIRYLTGQVLDLVRELPDDSVDLVATSPPFLALRDYNGIEGQWGSEATPAAFLDHLLELAVELRRVLTPTGSIAIELGDSYSGSGGPGGDYSPDGIRAGQPKATRTPNGTGWPLPKSLTGVPTLFAWSLAYGRNLLGGIELKPWLVRNVIVWAKNNPAVGALGDKVRPASSYITVATPSPRRWFDLDAVRTPTTSTGGKSGGWTSTLRPGDKRGVEGPASKESCYNGAETGGAPPLDHWHDEPDGDLCWLINTQGSSLSHYAMWPPKLAERLILSMCPAQVCRECGEPRRRIISATEGYVAHRVRSSEAGTNMRAERVALGMGHGGRGSERMKAEYSTLGWSDCGHNNNYRPGHVLDPFCGTGTSLAVADIHGRDATGFDLDPANELLYPARYEQCWKALKPNAGPAPVSEHGEQLTLMGGKDD